MRIVIKTGSAILSKTSGGLDREAVARIAKVLSGLHKSGHEIILVSSGAIAAGVARLGWRERPKDLPLKQAAAAVGQLALMETYEAAFSQDGIVPAQVLLTRDDLVNRERYLNIRNTLLQLLSLRTIPIINENDTVSTEEIQFGDNDTLSAVVATKVGADKLILLSDVPGVYEQDKDGQLTKTILRDVSKITPEMERDVSSAKGSGMAVGGMKTKFLAAKMATTAGVETWIGSGFEPECIERILAGDREAGTRFLPKNQRFESRQVWIAFGRAPKGHVIVDDGAVAALVDQRKSLLASGIKQIRGSFSVGDTIGIKSRQGVEVARGLANFSSQDLKKIRGRHSSEISALLGRAAAGEVVHRDNLVLF